ncbi:MAG: sialidase family protein [Planctomycetota bacterium]|jgi:sialidase-1
MRIPTALGVVLCGVALLLGPARADENGLEQIDVFVSGRLGYHTYRIPALIVSPRGTLLVFCEGRKQSRSDDGDIDMLLRRSTDGGKTWLPVQLVHEEGGDARIKFGNPCPIVDSETKTVWLSMNRDYLDDRGRRQGGAIVLMHSSDDGRTWSAPVDVTAQVKRPNWGHYAQGPGVGVQIRRGPHKGRLVVPANYRESFDKRQPSYSHVIYSDDHGKRWQLGGILGPYTNECQVVQILEDGKPGLLINMRNHWGRAGQPERSGRRLVSRSFDGGRTWSPEAMDPALSDPPCQASILRYSWAEGDQKSCIAFANPAGPGRANLTVRLSYDEGRTWPVSKTIYKGSAAYSCLARLADGRLGLIYERDDYGKLTFASLALAWLESRLY